MSATASMFQGGTGGAASGAPSAKPADNTVTLIIGGQSLTGWQSVRITRGLDRIPSDFDISLTELYPTQATQTFVWPGQTCTLMIGADVILVGYVDRYMPSLSAQGHQVRITGRSKCEDLVDCSITTDELNGMSMSTSSLLTLAQTLSTPFGITVSSLTGNNVPVQAFGGAGPLVFSAVLTETPWDIIERVARWAAVLAYDGADGNLILANVGASKMASGFYQGVNVEAASVAFTQDQRYSIYLPYLMSSNFFGNQGAGGVAFQPAMDNGIGSQIRADGKPRYRPLIIVSEQFALGVSMAQMRAQWEMARRAGRSQAIRLTCDSWRDQAGTLWTPNAYAPINLPALKVSSTLPSMPWVIAEVTFRRDLEGTHTDVTMMPPQAFQPEPIILTPFLWDPSSGTPPPAGGAAATTAPPSLTGTSGLQDGVS